jgi:3-phenylpropionate/trans-cinnamate dioxygenase ferredoxin subunit
MAAPPADADGTCGGRLQLDVADLAPGAVRRVDCGGRGLLLCHTPDGFFAVEDRCSHAASALAGGRLSGCILECPLHGARFDVRSGRPTAPPARRPIATFQVSVSGSRAEIRWKE